MSTQRKQSGVPMSKWVKFVLSMGAVAGALVLTLGVVAAATGISAPYTTGKAGVGGGPPVTGQKGFSQCGDAGQPACPGVPNTWVPITSESARDVIAALQSCPDFMSPKAVSSSPTGDEYTFDAPVLVKPATRDRSAATSALSHFIIRAVTGGVRKITYDVLYDSSLHQIRISSVGEQVPNDPHYNKGFPWNGVPADVAVSTLQASRGLALAVGKTPELVYFAAQPIVPGKPSTWTGGGTNPAEPIWRLKGSDGHAHFVGIDGRLYEPAQLPVKPGATILEP